MYPYWTAKPAVSSLFIYHCNHLINNQLANSKFTANNAWNPKLQNLLSKSWYARLLAVRRVTQDNRGRHTAGIDGVKSLQPPQRLRLANELTLDDTATPLRRIWIPKRGTPEKRPLGVPTLHERARQTVVRQALEPEWEAKLSAHFYGFRPGRSCWDAIAAVFHRIKFRPQYRLKVDIAQCLDHTS